MSGGFVEQATQRYQTIVEGYDDMLTKAKEVVSATTPSFYSATTQPDTDGSLVDKRDLLFLALSIALGGIFCGDCCAGVAAAASRLISARVSIGNRWEFRIRWR